jgi:hypothetical protein
MRTGFQDCNGDDFTVGHRIGNACSQQSKKIIHKYARRPDPVRDFTPYLNRKVNLVSVGETEILPLLIIASFKGEYCSRESPGYEINLFVLLRPYISLRSTSQNGPPTLRAQGPKCFFLIEFLPLAARDASASASL